MFAVATALAIGSGARRRALAATRSARALWLILNLVSLATFYLLLQLGLPGRRAGDRLRRRGDDHVPVRDRLPGRRRPTSRPATRRSGSWRRRSVAGGALVAEVVLAIASHSFGSAPEVGANFGGAEAVPARCSRPVPARLRGGLGGAAGGRGGRRRAGHAPARPPRAGRARRRSPSACAPHPSPELQTLVMGAETTFPVHHRRRRRSAADGGRRRVVRRPSRRSCSGSACTACSSAAAR